MMFSGLVSPESRGKAGPALPRTEPEPCQVWSRSRSEMLSSRSVLWILTLALLIFVSQVYRVWPQCDPDQGPPRPKAADEVGGADTVGGATSGAERLDLERRLPQRLQYPQPSITKGRTDVVTVTPWLAPVVWESTFNPELMDAIFKPRNLSIAVTVFAVGKYIMFLKDFLLTSEQFFFLGYNVHIYVFTDRPQEVPQVKMAAGRKVSVRTIPGSRRWQDISARRMEMIHFLLQRIQDQTDFVFCLDVDSKFRGHWGAESLEDTVAVVHPGYYWSPRSEFPFERRPVSRAFMAPSDGDFYYCGGAFGGSVPAVLDLTRTCSENYKADEREGVEAAWQEESHLNRYFWENKPRKVLSPEYLWQDFKPRNPEIRIVRFAGVIKNYAAIRPN